MFEAQRRVAVHHELTVGETMGLAGVATETQRG
jgi:hypothetical protein